MEHLTLGTLAVLAGLTLSGCADPVTRTDDTQSFLGINEDIRAVFSTGTNYKSPMRLLLAD